MPTWSKAIEGGDVVSAPTPHVLAVAAALPERVEAAVVLAGGGVDPEARGASGWVDRAAGFLAWRLPGVLGAYFWLMFLQRLWPASWVRGVARWLPGAEAVVLREEGVAELL
jgi:pimeloyl-ACP methyl ester carboxylesterase